jgi:hypothetical protein
MHEMRTRRVELRVGLRPGRASAALVFLACLLFFAGEPGTETLTMTATLPAPSTAYRNLYTTGNVTLARTSGNVYLTVDGGGLGVATSNPLRELDVNGTGNVSGGLAVGGSVYQAGGAAAPNGFNEAITQIFAANNTVTVTPSASGAGVDYFLQGSFGGAYGYEMGIGASCDSGKFGAGVTNWTGKNPVTNTFSCPAGYTANVVFEGADNQGNVYCGVFCESVPAGGVGAPPPATCIPNGTGCTKGVAPGCCNPYACHDNYGPPRHTFYGTWCR